MPDLTQSAIRNRLLAALSSEDFALLRPRLECMSFGRGDVIIRPREPIEHVYFLEAGVTSIVAANASGRRIEIGLVGRDGLAGTSVVLGVSRSPHETFIQVGGSALRIESCGLRDALRTSPSLSALLLRYVEAFSIQVAHTAVSNGSYSLGERLARWLLMCHDRIDGDELPLTHEFIAIMLGVRRAGVTVALHILEGEHIIRAERGSILVLDRDRLEAAAGDSYGMPEEEYRRLIGPFR